jgi:hypothetical protein
MLLASLGDAGESIAGEEPLGAVHPLAKAAQCDLDRHMRTIETARTPVTARRGLTRLTEALNLVAVAAWALDEHAIGKRAAAAISEADALQRCVGGAP